MLDGNNRGPIRDVQFSNARLPIVVTLDGIDTFVKALLRRNEFAGIVVGFAGDLYTQV